MQTGKKIGLIGIMVTVMVVTGIVGALASSLEIFVKNKVVVNSSSIRLGDICTFRPATDPRIGKLASIKIAPSPPPGTSSTVNHDFLIYRLSSFLANEKDVRVKVPESLHVRRAARIIKQGQLIRILEGYLEKHSPWTKHNTQIKRVRCPEKVILPRGKLRWTVHHEGRTHWVGPVKLIVTFWVNDKPVTRIPIQADLLVKQQFLKVRAKLRRGHVLQPDDVIVIARLTDSFNGMYLHNPNDAVGKQLLRTVLQGQLLTKSMLREVPWVKRGQQVRILAENEHIKVVTTGRALEDGREGDQVRVVNTSSGKQIYATVKGPGMVVVQF